MRACRRGLVGRRSRTPSETGNGSRWREIRTLVLSWAILWIFAAGCAPRQLGGGQPPAPASYTALPDTVVCVIDRSESGGLREIPAKVGSNGVVLYEGGAVQPLETVHPVNVIAGYAGREQWLTRGEPITFEGRRYVRYVGERRIAPDLLRRVGEHRGILLFTGSTSGMPPEVLYVPTSPGCIFQPFAREDVVNG